MSSWNLPFRLFHQNTNSVHVTFDVKEENENENENEKEFENDNDMWKQSVKKQLEVEIERRVREALDTPPGERLRRNQEEAHLRIRDNRSSIDSLNAHFTTNYADRDQKRLREQRRRMFQNFSNGVPTLRNNVFDNTSGGNGSAELHCSNGYHKSSDKSVHQWPRSSTEGFGSSIRDKMEDNDMAAAAGRAVRFAENTEMFHHFRTGREAMMHFGNLSEREKLFLFLNFTKEGFLEALRIGRLPDGTPLENVGADRFRDVYGIIRDKHGPFWPRERGPLHASPRHRRSQQTQIEPLITESSDILVSEPSQTFDNQTSCYNGQWRGVNIVFDSEKSPRNFAPIPVADDICPSLVFESRFECGNLRQARRIGQFEYELVLSTDLFTKRHTQWFYFRISNTIPGITYRFIIVNFLKSGSLYNEGMRPLLYSEFESSNSADLGWRRAGHHIRYSRNVTHLQCPLLHREFTYYQLDWQLEFPQSKDTYYLAHCYPYSFSDLQDDLNRLYSEPDRQAVMKKEVLCETIAGNSCFLLTITDTEKENSSKKGIVVTGRVHPGESNASWMMLGFIEFISSKQPVACTLRENFVFKVVPMLNPDGVIVGNYRCSLAARDLNRNYRHPRRENFPTIFCLKEMIDSFSKTVPIILYCDMHGHSRKQNVFMYGCDSQYRHCDATQVNGYKPNPRLSNTQEFISDRLFPWLVAKKAPCMFNFNGCRFNIRRCKESTGRVVMWRQMRIENSFTMEATFSGTTIDNEQSRHFNAKDLELMGRAFGESVMDFYVAKENKERYTEVVLEMTQELLLHIIETRGIMTKDKIKEFRVRKQSDLTKSNEQLKELLTVMSAEMPQLFGAPSINNNSSAAKNKISDELTNNLSKELSDNCFNILDRLRLSSDVIEENDSSSSDSNSESEPELIMAQSPEKTLKKKKKSKKVRDNEKKSQKKKGAANTVENKFQTLPALADENGRKIKSKKIDAVSSDNKPIKVVNSCISTQPKESAITQLFINKYDGRSNGGIPCFSEERLLERAAKRLYALHKKSEESFNKGANLKQNEPMDETLTKSKETINIELIRRRLHQALQLTNSSYQKSSFDKVLPFEMTTKQIGASQINDCNNISPTQNQDNVTFLKNSNNCAQVTEESFETTNVNIIHAIERSNVNNVNTTPNGADRLLNQQMHHHHPLKTRSQFWYGKNSEASFYDDQNFNEEDKNVMKNDSNLIHQIEMQQLSHQQQYQQMKHQQLVNNCSRRHIETAFPSLKHNSLNKRNNLVLQITYNLPQS